MSQPAACPERCRTLDFGRSDRIVGWEQMNLSFNFEDTLLLNEAYDRVRSKSEADTMIAVVARTAG